MSMKLRCGEFVGLAYASDDELREFAEEILADNAKLRDAMYTNAGKYALQHMDEYELRIWATQQSEYIEELRELCTDLFDRLRDKDEHCGECRSSCEYDAWNFGDPKCVYAKRMRELGIEADNERKHRQDVNCHKELL